MKYVEVAGARIPALGLGTWQVRGAECRRMVETALDLGYRHIDTARMYENEDEVGRALAASTVAREEVFLTTKLFLDELTRDAVLACARESCDRLRTDWIDLLLVHWPNPEIPLEETFGALAELERDAVIRNVGVSNFPAPLFEQALDVDGGPTLICDQVEYHPYLSQSDLLATLGRLDRMLTAYCPLARGRVMDDPLLQAIGDRHGKTPAQVTLRWHMSQQGVAAIPKARSREHLEQNLDVFDFELEPDELQSIFRLARGERLIDPDFAPQWS